jgi:hypothetical protein
MCYSLRNLYIKNLTVNLNVSWSPLNYESIYFIISTAANTKKITISVSPYTYNLLSQSDFDLAKSKNITIELLTANYVEDKRLGDIANKADKTYVDEIAQHLAEGAVLYIPQTLTEEQKAQARDNIGSVGVEEFNALKSDIETALDNIISIQNKLIGGESV